MPTTDVLKNVPMPPTTPPPQRRQVQFTPKSTLPEIASQLARHPYTGAAPKSEQEYYLNSLTNNITSNGPLNAPGNRQAIAAGTKPMGALTSRFVEYLKNNKQRADAVRETSTGTDGLPKDLPAGYGLPPAPKAPKPAPETKAAAAVSMNKKASATGMTKFFKPTLQKEAEDTSDLTEEELAEYNRRSHSRWKSFFKGVGLGALGGGAVGGTAGGLYANGAVSDPETRGRIALMAARNPQTGVVDMGRANAIYAHPKLKSAATGVGAGMGAAMGLLPGALIGGAIGAIGSDAPQQNAAILQTIRARRNKQA